jgi:hypothetical protein
VRFQQPKAVIIVMIRIVFVRGMSRIIHGRRAGTSRCWPVVVQVGRRGTIGRLVL